MGVYDKKWMLPIAQVLKELGSEHLLIVHSEDGLDEISIAAPTSVVEMKKGTITEFQICPEDFGFETSSLGGLEANSPEQSLQIANLALRGEHKAASAMVAMAAGAALYISDISDSLDSGVELAKDCIKEGGGVSKLNELIDFSSKF